MMRGMFTLATLASVIFFPWPFSAVLAFASASLEPLVPLAAGLLADTLYYTPYAGALPVFTFYGAVVSIVAVFVRSRMRAGTIS